MKKISSKQSIIHIIDIVHKFITEQEIYQYFRK